MTLGEKIRCARKRCGFSQEQLAQKICISRSAVAKWETDKGMPDIENLKTISRLLGVSTDHLLDDSYEATSTPIREPINLSAFGRGCKKVKKDRLMRQRFPGAVIFALQGRPEFSAQENVVDSTLGFLTPLPFGTAEFLKSVRDLAQDFYLVEWEDEQFFATVTEHSLEFLPLAQKQTTQTFQLGNWVFVRCGIIPEI